MAIGPSRQARSPNRVVKSASYYNADMLKKTTALACLICAWAAPLATSAAAPAPSGYAIAAAHPAAVSAGEEMFAAGGNAFDAAVAVSAVLAVVEPYSSGLGGGGFWLLHHASDGRDEFVDGRETAPGAAHRDMYLDADGELIPGKSLDGPTAAGIPGTPAALAHLSRHGRLPLARTLAPAIRLAEEGVVVHAGYAGAVRRRLDVIKRSPAAARIFLDAGATPSPGWRLRQTDLAKTLRALATSGRAGFYRGPVAEELVRAVRAAGGIWTAEDLEQYRVKVRRPITFTYRGARIVSAPPPSSGGVALAQIFNMLGSAPAAKTRADEVHYIVEAMRRAYRDRSIWLGDADFVDVPLARLTNVAYAHTLAAGIDAARATPSAALRPTSAGERGGEGRDTTHFSIIDAEGNRVASTMSINYGFGCGFVAGASGVLLNNEMDDFVAKPGAANVYGLTGGAANAIAPGKRMLSSMSPTFVDDGARLAIIGTPGGSRIITMVLHGVRAFLAGGDAQAVVSAPRFHHQYLPDRLEYEKGALDEATRTALERMGHVLREAGEYGDMHAVVWDYRRKTLDAASDPRGHGAATTMPSVRH